MPPRGRELQSPAGCNPGHRQQEGKAGELRAAVVMVVMVVVMVVMVVVMVVMVVVMEINIRFCFLTQ